ncbi:hypothetical protein GALMADRAFT_759478 [Galerina marginata CBS 339.88]|uniref:Fungal-type protein kinase domain-containing protein n=1 Tax=Galerina marginata (strain CBS 339.88) TaxID=685588 RepID=A0A067SRJ1_GALM3|nr:hypothetical protein GALMADRAFT_759478 [Galerina marginata CBS 339.88]
MSTPSLTFNTIKVQDIDINDDQESFLYVLSWIALLYTKHSQLNSLPTLLKDYDDLNVNFGGKITGGQYKRYFLSTGLSDLEFTDRPSLGALIDELRLHFRDLRTLSTPTQEDKDDLEEIKRIGKITWYQCDKTYKHELLVQRLNNRKWLVETFRKHLATGPWPKDDAAELNSSFLVSDMTEMTDLRLERWCMECDEKLQERAARLASGCLVS